MGIEIKNKGRVEEETNNYMPKLNGKIGDWIKRRGFTIFVVAMVVCLLVINGLLYYYAKAYEKSNNIQGASVGLVKMCINNPPNFNKDCYPYALVTSIYTCNPNGTDPDNQTLQYYDNSSFYNISSLGVITFTPRQSQIGVETSTIRVNDGAMCKNSNATKDITIRVCMEPYWSNFENSLTTNLSLLPCWNNVENFKIGRVSEGVINFSGNLSLDGYNFDTNLEIRKNYISYDSRNLPSLYRNASITFFNLTFLSLVTPAISRNGVPCISPYCNIVNYSNDSITFNVTKFNGTYFVLGNQILNIFDDTPTYIRYVNESVMFYANFTYVNGTPISDGNCAVLFNSVNDEVPTSMNYNATFRMYIASKKYYLPGNYVWNVTCNRDYESRQSDALIITNRPPLFTNQMPNETWNQGTTLTGRDLDDYFMDPDKENLNFTTTSLQDISISIDPLTHIITITPDPGFFGNRSVIYYGYDAARERVESNIIYLYVIEVPQVESPQSPTGQAGGGGGAAIASACIEDWVCTEWSECLATGIEVRKCLQQNGDCNTKNSQPEMSRKCYYYPTCYDIIKNGQEEGVDCGGPVCKPCASCSDLTQNQGEEGVDCGGPCQRCTSCFDGIQNGGEMGVDCGSNCDICASCFDGVLNQHEERADCGGECDLCPTCSDGKQNQGEENIDCGGPCQKCGGIELLSPKNNTIFGVLMIIMILVVLGYIFGKKYASSITMNFKETKFFGFSNKKENGRVDINKIGKDTIVRINLIEKNIGVNSQSVDNINQNTRESFDKLFSVMKRFFGETTEMKEKFNADNFIIKIKEVDMQEDSRNLIKDYILNMEEMGYSHRNVDDKKLLEIISYSKKIVNKFVKIMTENIEREIKKENSLKADEKDIEKIIQKIEYSLKKNDLETAREDYQTALKNYKKLDLENQKKYYKMINRIGENINQRIGGSKQN